MNLRHCVKTQNTLFLIRKRKKSGTCYGRTGEHSNWVEPHWTNMTYTTTEEPIKQNGTLFPIHQKEERQAQVEDMLKYYILVASFSPWASPAALAKNKDGSTQFCIDHRKKSHKHQRCPSASMDR